MGKGKYVNVPYSWFKLKKKIGIQCEELLLLACITGLVKEGREVYASDEYFCDVFQMTKRELRYRMSNLEKSGLIKIEREDGKRIIKANKEKIASLLN